MNLRTYLFVLILLFFACSKKMDKSMMEKNTYTGNELRIDGYYYSDVSNINDIGIAIFYGDGVCFHFYAKPESLDTLTGIENCFLSNDEFIEEVKNVPQYLGVFNIFSDQIEFEIWDFGGDGITTFSHFGEILNDTTFAIKERVNNGGDITFSENLTYRFKNFNPKPDSTNVWIE